MIHSPLVTAILLAILVFPIVPLLHIAFSRFFRTGRMKTMLYTAIFYVLCWLFLTRYLTQNNLSLGIILGGAYIMGFLLLGYAESFSMIARGFSLHILVDVYRNRGRTLDELLKGYSGRGKMWVMEKRIHTLTALKMLEEKNGTLYLKKRGWFAGKIGLLVKSILKLGRGG